MTLPGRAKSMPFDSGEDALERAELAVRGHGRRSQLIDVDYDRRTGAEPWELPDSWTGELGGEGGCA